MATENRLRASIDPAHQEHLSEVEAEIQEEYPHLERPRTEAERKVFEAGLEALGYVERPRDAATLFLWYARQIGYVLGLVGLILIGYGIFWGQLVQVIGLGLLILAFPMIAAWDVLPRLTDRFGDDVAAR